MIPRKSEEQVLKEIALDRIEFAMGRIRWLTRVQLEALSQDLRAKQPKGTIPAQSDNRTGRRYRPLEHMYDFALERDEMDRVHRWARSKRHGHKFTATALAKFYSLDDAWNAAQGRED